jgi:phasin
MASSPKKGHRSALRHEPPPLATAIVEPPAAPASDISSSALQAAEGMPPVAEIAEAPPAELLPPPVAEVVTPVAELTQEAVAEAAPPVVEVAEVTQAAVAIAAEPTAPQLQESPAPVEALAPAAFVEAGKPPAAVKDFGNNVRTLVEKGLVESRARFAQAKTAAEETSAAVEASCDAARDGVVAFNVKAIENVKASVDANFDLVVSLALAKSISELVLLQSEFARKQIEETTSQAKALAELARKVADETVAPIKAHVAKTFKVAV